MTADAPNSERRWVCAINNRLCTPEFQHRGMGCGYVAAAPVPPRPDTASEALTAVHVYATALAESDDLILEGVGCDLLALLNQAADAHPVTDQGPDLSELRAARAAIRGSGLDTFLIARPFGRELVAAVDRLLADRGNS